MGNIASATKENPIVIIPEALVDQAVLLLQHTFIREYSKKDFGVVIPIELGGHELGEDMCHPGDGVDLVPNPMQMSHYPDDGTYHPKPICKMRPDLYGIIDLSTGFTRDVFFAEAVVESQETIIAAQEEINQMIDEYNLLHLETHFEYPMYHTFALVSKTTGDIKIPNYHYAFAVNKDIWVRGRGCDDKGLGREKRDFLGRIGDHTKNIPPEPYYEKSSMWN